MNPAERKARASLLARGIVIDAIHIPIKSTERHTMHRPTRLATPPGAADLPGVDAKTAQKALDAFAVAAGLPAGSSRTVLEATFKDCCDVLDPAAVQAMGRRLGLSAQEIAACVDLKCDPRIYVELKSRRSRR